MAIKILFFFFCKYIGWLFWNFMFSKGTLTFSTKKLPGCICLKSLLISYGLHPISAHVPLKQQHGHLAHTYFITLPFKDVFRIFMTMLYYISLCSLLLFWAKYSHFKMQKGIAMSFLAQHWQKPLGQFCCATNNILTWNSFVRYLTKVQVSLFEKQKLTSLNIIIASFLRASAPCVFSCLSVCVSCWYWQNFRVLRLKISVWGVY